VYISEGRDAAAVQHLEAVAREACSTAGGAALASLFVDAPYNRSNFCLVGRSAEQLALAATLLSRAALELLDFRQHAATHPRLGTVDHMSCHPLAGAAGGAGMHHAAGLAHAIGEQLGSGEAAVPVYLYGAAHPQQQSLADVRRSLGYFRGAAQGGSPRRQSTALLDTATCLLLLRIPLGEGCILLKLVRTARPA
jgi:glutamate formiminotransferase